jgi:cytoplasmic tRNA 2-thiolation protein 2
MAQGEGFVLKEEVEEVWTGLSEGGPKIKICKPMRDVGMKECAAYAWWTGLHIVGKEKVPGVKDGIAGLTKGCSALFFRAGGVSI